MRRLFFIVKKEFLQILHNRVIILLMTIIPIVQLIVLSFAANNEVKNVQLTIIDKDNSEYSRQLISKIQQSNRFIISNEFITPNEMKKRLKSGTADMILTIPTDFEKSFYRNEQVEIQLLINAIKGMQANVGGAYLNKIIQKFNRRIKIDLAPQMIGQQRLNSGSLQIEVSNWFNPTLNYKHFMLPGILGVLITVLVMMLTAMNIVREREIGTIEQINVTPIKKWQFILGKMIPFLIIGMFILVVGLVVGKAIFQIPFNGNLAIIFSYCLLNLTAVLGLGLLISNLSDTQQQAMFITFFFAITFVLMCGLFTPIESMPQWAQYLTIPNPLAHFVSVMRSVLLKGSTFGEVIYHFQITTVLAIIFNFLAIRSYRKIAN